jgi:hypothetical protein
LLSKIDDEMLKCRDQKGFDTLVVYTLTDECWIKLAKIWAFV